MAKKPNGYALLDPRKPSPKREVMQPDGTIRVEKMTPIPYHKKMVDPDGNIIAVSLATGRNFPIGVDQGNQVAVVMKLRKQPPKFLPFDECPVTKGYMPNPDGDAGCKGDDGQGGFGTGKPDGAHGFRTGDGIKQACPHLRAVIAARRAAKRKKNDGVNRRFELHQDKVVKELASVTAALGAKVDHAARDAAREKLNAGGDSAGLKGKGKQPETNG